MPNYCWNVLNVYGESEELTRFFTENMEPAGTLSPEEAERLIASGKNPHIRKPLSFERSLPTPPEFEGTPPRAIDPMVMFKAFDGTIPAFDWYTWRIRNWGTKWDLDEDTHYDNNFEGGCLVYKFNTAWSPPLAWLMFVSKKYPTLTFRIEYEEGGCDFEGFMVTRNGVVLESFQGPYTRCDECGKRGCTSCKSKEE